MGREAAGGTGREAKGAGIGQREGRSVGREVESAVIRVKGQHRQKELPGD